MTLVRYNPLADFVPGTFGDFIENSLRESRKNSFMPKVDILKSEKSIEVQLVVPGMSKEDFTIDLDDNHLTISGERIASKQEGQEYIKRESQYGEFSRSFKLNDEINKAEISASYKEGILNVTLPLVEKKERKSVIKVK